MSARTPQSPRCTIGRWRAVATVTTGTGEAPGWMLASVAIGGGALQA
ncbi:MAG TPA: hypothetical protein VMW47_11660 [Verrucomicrobiae bacterium]|nr:hypothetical protein [Verrucomicrobiae bacterium]